MKFQWYPVLNGLNSRRDGIHKNMGEVVQEIVINYSGTLTYERFDIRIAKTTICFLNIRAFFAIQAFRRVRVL